MSIYPKGVNVRTLTFHHRRNLPVLQQQGTNNLPVLSRFWDFLLWKNWMILQLSLELKKGYSPFLQFVLSLRYFGTCICNSKCHDHRWTGVIAGGCFRNYWKLNTNNKHGKYHVLKCNEWWYSAKPCHEFIFIWLWPSLSTFFESWMH